MDTIFRTPLERFEAAAQHMAELKEKHGAVVVLYLKFREELDNAAESLKQQVLQGLADPYKGQWGSVTVATRNIREADPVLLESLLPARLVDEIIEPRVNIAKLDDAIARGEVSADRVRQAISTRETHYARAKLNV